MALTRRPDERFRINLRILAGAGINPPPEVAALRQRLEDFQRQAHDTAVVDQLTAHLIDGTDADVAALWAAACAEHGTPGPAKQELMLAIREKVNRAARDAYTPVAATNYGIAAERFNDAAQAFTDAATICDPNTPADQVVAASEKIRKAWSAGATRAAELDKLLPVLRAAAELAGLVGADPDDVVDLAVDANGLPREQVLAAWTIEDREAVAQRQANDGFSRAPVTHTRCGRWAALLAAGATLRAQPANQPALT